MKNNTTAFKLANWEVYPQLNQLIASPTGKKFVLAPKVMALLVLLSQQQGNPINLDEIAQVLWTNRIVSDSSIYQVVAQLRKALANIDSDVGYIEKISSKGYRIPYSIIITPLTNQDLFTIQRKTIITKKRVITFSFFALITAICFLSYVYFYDANKHKTPKTLSEQAHFETLTLAEYLRKQRQTTAIIKAKQLYQTILNEQPRHVEALYGLCETHRLFSIYSTASENTAVKNCTPLLKRILTVTPNHPESLALLGVFEQQAGNLDSAKALFKSAFNNKKTSATVFHWYGVYLRKQHRVIEALNAHKQAFSLSPNNPEILIHLAYAYLLNRDQEQARHYFKRSLIIAPNLRNAPLYSLDFYRLDKYRASRYLNWYANYGQLNTKRIPAYKLSYSLLLLSIGQRQKGIQSFNQINRLNEIPLAYRLYGEAAIAFELHQHETVVSRLQQRYEMAPSKQHFIMPLIHALMFYGDHKKAIALFEEHFSEITKLIAPTTQHINQYLTYANLLQKTQQLAQSQILISLLDEQHQRHTFSELQELKLYVLKSDLNGVDRAIGNLLKTSWLPDHNDNIFEFETIKQYLTQFQLNDKWLAKLNQHRSILIETL